MHYKIELLIMPRKKLTKQEMLTKPYYRSILALTHLYEDNELFLDDFRDEKDGEKGLQQIHYRYALQENPDMPDHYMRKMEYFFDKEENMIGADLEYFFKETEELEKKGMPGRLYRNCIKKGTHLNFYLKNLVNEDLLYRKKGNDGNYRYITTHSYYVDSASLVCNLMKSVSGFALDVEGYVKDTKDIRVDKSKGIVFGDYFISQPDFLYGRESPFVKEYGKAIEKIKEGIMILGEYLKENAPPNKKIKEDTVCLSYDDFFTVETSHRYGLYIDFSILSDKGLKQLQKQLGK